MDEPVDGCSEIGNRVAFRRFGTELFCRSVAPPYMIPIILFSLFWSFGLLTLSGEHFCPQFGSPYFDPFLVCFEAPCIRHSFHLILLFFTIWYLIGPHNILNLFNCLQLVKPLRWIPSSSLFFPSVLSHSRMSFFFYLGEMPQSRFSTTLDLQPYCVVEFE